MSVFETYQKEIQQLLEYEDFQNLQKRIIDLTLDTQDLSFYKKTVILLDWLDNDQKEKHLIKDKYSELLKELWTTLNNKDIRKRRKLLDVENLIKAYSNSYFALGPISFSISEGEIFGLVGENGNGKTTLLRALCGELEPTGGNIKYHFEYKNQYDLRTQLIYIPQRTKDWHGSLLSNLRFTASSYGITGDENIYLVELVIARMGLRKYRAFDWKSLSSGYKMRFELARMLLRKPKILLIDEPLANLDILAQQVILDDFRNIAKSPFRPLGIVLSSQQLYEVEKTSDQVIFLKEGKPNADNYVNSLKTDAEESTKENKLIIEFESEWDQEQLRILFSSLDMENFRREGGNFIVTFSEKTSLDAFLQIIVDNKIPLNYFRNISNSTRRFFLS